MAYPLIAPAVADLFEDTANTVNIQIVRAGAYIPMEAFESNSESNKPATIPYGVVRAAVLQAKGERSICIGYVVGKTSEVVLTPDHDKHIHFTIDDKLVILRRNLTE